MSPQARRRSRIIHISARWKLLGCSGRSATPIHTPIIRLLDLSRFACDILSFALERKPIRSSLSRKSDVSAHQLHGCCTLAIGAHWPSSVHQLRGPCGLVLGARELVVPWLGKQFELLAHDATLTDEQRYFVAGTHAHLGCVKYAEVLSTVITETEETSVLLALKALIYGGCEAFFRSQQLLVSQDAAFHLRKELLVSPYLTAEAEDTI